MDPRGGSLAGKTVTVATSGSTTYHAAAATASDVTTGQTVSVPVSRDPDAATSSASTTGSTGAEDVTITGE